MWFILKIMARKFQVKVEVVCVCVCVSVCAHTVQCGSKVAVKFKYGEIRGAVNDVSLGSF
jgi:hypothetical protein